MQSKPNLKVAQASVLESNSASASGGFHTFALFPLPFYFSTKRTQFDFSILNYKFSIPQPPAAFDVLYLHKRPI